MGSPQTEPASKIVDLGVCAYSPDCIKVLDSDGTIQFFNDDGLRVMEIDDITAVKGVYWPLLWPEASRPQLEDALGQAANGGVATLIAPCPTAKGTPKWWDVTIAAVPGVTRTYVVVSRDITEERDARIAERSAFDRLRTIGHATPDVLWDADLQTGEVWWSDGIQALFGHKPADIGAGMQWRQSHIHPDDLGRVAASMTAAVEGTASNWEGEFRYRAADGSYLEVLDRGAIIRDSDGTALRFVGVMQDITIRKAQADVYELVAGELAHRVNNILAVVTGLFQQSLRSSAGKPELAEAFGRRLLALANANSAIVKGAGRGAELHTLAEGQLRPFIDAGRLRIDGPPIAVPAEVAQPLALALNELATNALKYGALSGEQGDARLNWTVSASDGRRQINLAWTEAGGPPVVPPERKGLGSRLIQDGIPGAIVERRFDPQGFTCAIQLSLRD